MSIQDLNTNDRPHVDRVLNCLRGRKGLKVELNDKPYDNGRVQINVFGEALPVIGAKSALYGGGKKPLNRQPKPGIDYVVTAYEGRETVRTTTTGPQPAVIDIHFRVARGYERLLTPAAATHSDRQVLDDLFEHLEAENIRLMATYGMTDEQLDKMTFGELDDLRWQEEQRGL